MYLESNKLQPRIYRKVHPQTIYNFHSPALSISDVFIRREVKKNKKHSGNMKYLGH